MLSTRHHKRAPVGCGYRKGEPGTVTAARALATPNRRV